MRRKQIGVFPSLPYPSLTKQPFLACLKCHSWDVLGPGTAQLGHRLPRVRQCSQGRAGQGLVAVWDCNADSAVHCRAQTPNTTACVRQGSAQAAVPGESLTPGASPPSTPGREQREGLIPCHCCSACHKAAGTQGRGVLLYPCVGVVLPAATLAALSSSEVPTDDPCLKGHIHLSFLHPSVLIWVCQGRAGLHQTYSGCAKGCCAQQKKGRGCWSDLCGSSPVPLHASSAGSVSLAVCLWPDELERRCEQDTLGLWRVVCAPGECVQGRVNRAAWTERDHCAIVCVQSVPSLHRAGAVPSSAGIRRHFPSCQKPLPSFPCNCPCSA